MNAGFDPASAQARRRFPCFAFSNTNTTHHAAFEYLCKEIGLPPQALQRLGCLD